MIRSDMSVKAGDVWGGDWEKGFKRPGDSWRTPALLQAQWYKDQRRKRISPSGAPKGALSSGEIQVKKLRLCEILLMMDQELRRQQKRFRSQKEERDGNRTSGYAEPIGIIGWEMRGHPGGWGFLG